MRTLGIGSWCSEDLWNHDQLLPFALAYRTYGQRYLNGYVVRPIRSRAESTSSSAGHPTPAT